MLMYIIEHLIRTAKLGTDVSIHYLGRSIPQAQCLNFFESTIKELIKKFLTAKK